ncbi:NRDE-2, necessary for RNA interference-domain-containing protein [Chaetomium fimeti]|uniref:NRDE-2, necessary for RNA interference-domain-containing protein n=1 Tax=Chaetomium fimeti TaxID=1854472 RepID=A0AAE0HIF6_9PEZI|nr:NRDE-2, necessary for RNA interference-domain-containing protein [Chaetomium fimeti]
MEKEKEKERKKETRRAVPKFGSFKPNLTPESALEAPLASKETRAHKDGLGGAERDSDRRRHERDRDGDRHGERRHSSHARERQRDGHGDRDRDRARDRDRDRKRERERERDKHHEREREKRRRKESEREDHRDRHGQQPPRPGSPRAMSSRNKNQREDPSSMSNDLFVVDKRGDPLIVQYGSNDRSQVPVYYRFGAGRLVGSPGFLTIHRDGAQEQFSIRGPGEGSRSGSAFRDKALVTAAFRSRSKHIKSSEEQPLPTTSEDFISLAPSRKRKRTEDEDEDDPTDQPPPDYRSIHGKARPNTRSDSDSDSGSESESNPRSPSDSPSTNPSQPTPLTRASHLSRHVKTTPSDIPAWLELIDLQDALFTLQTQHATSNPTQYTTRTADETRALAELKLSLYQEALPHATAAHPPADRERLLLGMMREAGRVWGEEALERKWAELVAVEDGAAAAAAEGGGGGGGGGGGIRFGLWRGKLDFEMGRVVGFGFEGVRGEIVRMLRVLGGEVARVGGGGSGEGEEEEVCGRVVYVFLRLTRFLHDAGFVELAVAAWQAMVEMVFCRPPGDFTAEVALASFAAFWESEVARMGEEGARGWKHFVEAGEDMVDPPEPRVDTASEVPRKVDPLEAWAAAEQREAEKARMPARTLDEGTDDDPFRVIMFSDIKDLLVWIPSALLPRVRPLLADAFLVFCGLPTAQLSEGGFATMLDDPFVSSRAQGLDLGLIRNDTGATQDLSRRIPEFRQEGGSMAISPNALFAGDSWFRYLNKWSDTHQPGDRQVDISWGLRTLEYLVKDYGMEPLAEYYLAMEWLNGPTKARKVAKGLLKQYSSNIRLYNAYALVECANGNAEVSNKVLSSATGLPSASDNQLLWNTWAWIHLQSNQNDLALARLVSSVENEFQGSTPPPVLLLKTKSHFSSTRDYSLSSQQLETATQYAESLMLLEYLTSEGGSEPASEAQGSITAALSTTQAFSHELESRQLHHSPHHERLLQTAARLLYHHATHGPHRPRHLRAHLETFTHLFPHNTLFLTLTAWLQPPLRIDDPVQHTLQILSLTPPHDRLGTRRFALHHAGRAPGNAHAVRAAFEAALAAPAAAAGAGSSELWLRYLRFCCARKELRGSVRGVFYRAIGACPWAKEVYMQAFGGVVREELGAVEVRAVGEAMVEKGLRVHVDLGGVLEGRG